jgi:hypothetical protein
MDRNGTKEGLKMEVDDPRPSPPGCFRKVRAYPLPPHLCEISESYWRIIDDAEVNPLGHLAEIVVQNFSRNAFIRTHLAADSAAVGIFEIDPPRALVFIDSRHLSNAPFVASLRTRAAEQTVHHACARARHLEVLDPA